MNGGMAKREDIIRALECRLNINDSRWKNCPSCKYAEELPGNAVNCHYGELFRDCLEWMKAQEGDGE